MNMTESIEIVLFLLCLGFSCFYSGTESALISIGIDRLRQIIDEGGTRAKYFRFLMNEPAAVLNTILIGNNLVNIFAASLTTRIAQRHFDDSALAISVGLTTLIILIFGEVLPKTFARANSEKLAYPALRFLYINYIVGYPIIKLFTLFIKKILGKSAEVSGRLITKADIEFMVNRAEEEKTIDSKQLDLLNSILEFPKIKVKDIMVPRGNVRLIKTNASLAEVKKAADEHGYSRYPVCEDDLDGTIGFLHIKDLAFLTTEEKQNFKLADYLKNSFFVYEHMKIQAVFDYMNRRKVHLALVKNENGLVVGIITLEDIVEEILGDIVDEHDDDELIEQPVKHIDGVVVNATISLRDLSTDYDIEIPLSDNYSTLAGFLLEMLGNNFPQQGQILFGEGYSFKLVKVENNEILEVKIRDVNEEKHLFDRNPDSEGHNLVVAEEKS